MLWYGIVGPGDRDGDPADVSARGRLSVSMVWRNWSQMRGRTVALVAILVLLLLVIAGWFGGGMMGYGRVRPYGWPGMMGGFGLGFGIWGMLMLLFWVLVIGGVVTVVFRLAERPAAPSVAGREGRGDSALDILRERYARGEITKEQFDQMRRDLEAP